MKWSNDLKVIRKQVLPENNLRLIGVLNYPVFYKGSKDLCTSPLGC